MPVLKKRRRPVQPFRKPVKPVKDEEITSESDIEEDEVSPKQNVGLSGEDGSQDEEEAVDEKRARLTKKVLEAAAIREDRVGGGGVLEEEDTEEEGEGEGDEVGVEERGMKEGVGSAGSDAGFVEKLKGFDGTDAVSWGEKRAHWLPVTCIAVGDNDNSVAVTGGKDSRIVVWDLNTGAASRIFSPGEKGRNPGRTQGHVGDVLAVAVGEGGLIASGGRDGMVRVWDRRAKKQVDCLKGHRGLVGALAFRKGTKQLFSGSTDRTVKIWELNEMAYVETLFGHGSEVNGLDSHVKERALSCGADGTVRLYKVIESSQLVFRRARTTSLDCVSMFSETRFFTGGDDGAVCLWQANKKKPVAVVEHSHGQGTGCEHWISCTATIQDSDIAISGAGDGTLKLWECKEGGEVNAVTDINLGDGFINGAAVCKNRNVIVAAVGQEHRRGRWSRLKKARNSLAIVKLPQ